MVEDLTFSCPEFWRSRLARRALLPSSLDHFIDLAAAAIRSVGMMASSIRPFDLC